MTKDGSGGGSKPQLIHDPYTIYFLSFAEGSATKLLLRVEQEKTHQFLMGLDDATLGTLRSQILSMEPLPTLNKAYALVTQEERHKTIVRGHADCSDALSFAIQSSHVPGRDGAIIPTTSERLICTYCGKLEHKFDQFFQQIGYPASHGSGRGRGRQGRGQGNSSNSGFGRAIVPLQ